MKTTGISTIAFGLIEGILVLVADSRLDFGAMILACLGVAVCRGSRTAALWAMVLSTVYVLGALTIGVAATAHGVQEVGLPLVLRAAVLGVWACGNLLLLSRVRRMPETPQPTPGPSEATGPKPPQPPLQFSLRWMFLATALVALACWSGIRLPPDDSWNMAWSYSSQGNTGLWVVQVVGYRSGTPVAGGLWRTEAKAEAAQGPTRVSVGAGGGRAELTVDGVPIQPTNDFQLFVNDSQDRPMRLVIPRVKAREVFGRPLDRSRIEAFWDEVVERQRSGKGRELSPPQEEKTGDAGRR